MTRLKSKLLLVAAGAALFAPGAFAQFNINNTDLMLVIRQADNAGKDLQFNLGNISLFYGFQTSSPQTPVSVFNNSTQFNSAFSSSVGLTFGVFGTDDGTGGFGQSTVWATKARGVTTPNTRSTAYNRQGQFQMDSASSAFGSPLSAANTFGSTATANSTTNSSTMAIMPVANANSYNQNAGTAGNFDVSGPFFGGNIENPAGGTTNGFSFVRSDLFEIRAGAGASTYLGYFDLQNNGAVMFTAVPEPGTLALTGMGALGAFGLVLRRNKKA